MLPCVVGRLLTPGRIEGFLWLGAALCWANGLLLYGLLRELRPKMPLLAVVAAALLVTDRSDQSRFYVLWTSNFYWVALALLQLGLLLFLVACRRRSRPLLALACLSLVASLLVNEAGLPLTLLAPALAWFGRGRRELSPPWALAWLGTVGLLGLRVLMFLVGHGADAYQAQQYAVARDEPRALIANLGLHLSASLTCFQSSGAATLYWRPAAITLAIATVLAILGGWRLAGRSQRRQYLVVAGVAAIALLLGSAPFLTMSHLFRTQFYSAPGWAVLLAAAFCLAGSWLGRRVGTAAVAVAVGLLTANATAESFAVQEVRHLLLPYNFERTVRVFRQIHAVCPNPPPHTLVLLFLDEPERPPFLCNYCCMKLGQHLLGLPLVQANCPGHDRLVPEFGPYSVKLNDGPIYDLPSELGYDQVLAFRLRADDTILLLDRLPDRFLPPHNWAYRYDPLTLLRPGPVKELAYLRHTSWSRESGDLFSMTDGVLLGRGWGPLEVYQGALTRQAAGEAELFVNGFGQRQRTLCLTVEAGPSGYLEALDAEGKCVASVPVAGRQEVRLNIPTDPERVTPIRLCVAQESQTVPTFRAFCPASPGRGDWLLPAQDVVVGDLKLGANWGQLECHRGQLFRWVTNDAELVLGADREGPGDLLLDLAPGPGLGGQPCCLELRDRDDRVLATVCVTNREGVRLAVPAGARAGTVLHLHVEGGGHPIVGDSRILNFCIHRCCWSAD